MIVASRAPPSRGVVNAPVKYGKLTPLPPAGGCNARAVPVIETDVLVPIGRGGTGGSVQGPVYPYPQNLVPLVPPLVPLKGPTSKTHTRTAVEKAFCGFEPRCNCACTKYSPATVGVQSALPKGLGSPEENPLAGVALPTYLPLA